MRETEKKPVNSIHQPTTKCKTLVEIELPKPDDDDHLQTQTLDGPRSNNITANGFRVSTSGGGIKSESTGDKGTDTDTEVDIGITLAQLSKETMSGGKIITTQKQPPPEEKTDLTSPNGNDSTAIASVGGCSTVARRGTAGNDLTVVAEKHDESKFGDDGGCPVIVDGKKESDFTVGEFVWGKVKTYPWWPGRVYNPSDASDYALNHKPQDQRQLLVAFFGDATFGWCNPSQLKPFVENFVEMSGQNTSRGFVQAVEDAASEFARLLKLEMSAGSADEKTIDDDIVNAGIKEGVKPPREGVRLYAVERFQPKEVISDLRRLGMSVNAVDLLKRVTLMSQVSVICKGRDELVEVEQYYGESVQDDDGGEKNVTFAGPPVEDVVAGEELDGPNQGEIGTMTSEHRALSSKRKSKSITEILDRATSVVNEVISDDEEQDDANVKGKDQSRRTGSKSRRYKRRRVETLSKEAQEIKNEGDGKLFGQSSKGNNQRKGLKDDEQQVSTAAAAASTSRQSQRLKGVSKKGGHDLAIESLDPKHKGKKKREDSPPPPSPVGSLEVVEIVSGPRERKKSKYLSPPFTNVAYEPRISTLLKAFEQAEGSSNATQTGDAVASSSTPHVGSAPDAKLSGLGEKVEETAKEVGGSGQNEAHHFSAQQMTPNTDKNHPRMSIVSPNSVLSQVQSAALTARPSDVNAGVGGATAADERSGSRRTKSLYRMTKEKSEETKAPAQDNVKEKNGLQSKVEEQANATDIESRVKNPDAKKQADAARNKAMGKEQKTTKKQQASDAPGNESTGKKQNNTKKQQPHTSGKENQGHVPSNKKQANAADKETQGKDPSSEPEGHVVNDKSSTSLSSTAAGAALSLKFPPDFPLPSETDLTAMFRGFGFGSLDESKTKVFQHSSSAKVVFLNSSDAKAAMQHCKEGNPFSSTTVTYRFRNLRAAPSSSAVAADIPDGNGNLNVLTPGGGSSSVKTKSTTSKKKRSAPVGLLEAEGLKFVKRKLEEMTTMVGSADGKVTGEMKSTLEAEMMVLLEKVRALPAS